MGEDDRDDNVEDVPELIESDGEDEGHGNNLRKFPCDLNWNQVEALELEQDKPFIDILPSGDWRHSDDRKVCSIDESTCLWKGRHRCRSYNSKVHTIMGFLKTTKNCK